MLLTPVSGKAQAPSPWIIVPGGGIGPVLIKMREANLNAWLGPPAAFCATVLGRNGDAMRTLYYPDRGLIIGTSDSGQEGYTVRIIAVVSGTVPNLGDSPNCSVRGAIVMEGWNWSMLYATRDGIGLFSPIQQVMARMGTPKYFYPRNLVVTHHA
jgi:hypothetical protein